MTLVERLRLESGEPIARCDCLEAADTIERLTERARLYEELRKAMDGGSESMTHKDAIESIQYLYDENDRLTRERDAITRLLIYHEGARSLVWQPSDVTYHDNDAQAVAEVRRRAGLDET